MGTFGLITLNLDRLVDDFLRYSPRFAPVATPLSGKGLKTGLPVLLQFPFECGKRRLFLLAVWEKTFLPTELFEIPVRLIRFDLPKKDRMQKRTPKNCPFFVFRMHVHLHQCLMEGTYLNSSHMLLPSVGKFSGQRGAETFRLHATDTGCSEGCFFSVSFDTYMDKQGKPRGTWSFADLSGLSDGGLDLVFSSLNPEN